jgi:hypothetical protein
LDRLRIASLGTVWDIGEGPWLREAAVNGGVEVRGREHHVIDVYVSARGCRGPVWKPSVRT